LFEYLGVRYIGRVTHNRHPNDLLSPPFKPIVMRPIQLHHLPKTLAPFPPGPMLAARPSRRPQLLLHQPATQRLVIQRKPILTQMLGGQSRPKISVAFAVTRQNLGAELPALAARAGLAAPPMNQA